MATRNTVRHPEAAKSWQNDFKASCFRTNFVLSLSQAMLEMLCAVSDGVQWDRTLYFQGSHVPDNWIASQSALVKRGLIQRKTDEEIKSEMTNRHQNKSIGVWEFNNYRLSPAGEAVVGLLKTTGLFVEADAAIDKKSRRA